jgi:uncharacterized protein (TIGR03435 family)
MTTRFLRLPALLAALALSLCVVVATPPIHAEQPAAAPAPAALATAAPAPAAPATAAPAPAAPAPAAKLPAFDVISVKTNNSAAHQMMMNFTPDGIRVTNVPIEFILRDAFGINGDQLINTPGWAKSVAYDIEAKVAPDDVPALKNLNREQRDAMMLNILADRFKLAYHRETRTLPEYALVTSKSGSKLQEFKPTTDENGKPRGNRMMMSGSSLTADGIDMASFTRMLANRIGRPIVDKTGLTAKYSFKLEWANEPHDGEGPGGPPHDAGPGVSSASADTGPSIFTALQEQLGLKLDSEKGPVEVIVIDHLEQPAAD